MSAHPQPKYDLFVRWCLAHGFPEPLTEYQFAEARKWRADYAWLTHHPPGRSGVIVEVNGGIWQKSGHSSGRGLLRDYAKANAAQVLGFVYLTYTPDQLMTPQSLADLQAVLL